MSETITNSEGFTFKVGDKVFVSSLDATTAHEDLTIFNSKRLALETKLELTVEKIDLSDNTLKTNSIDDWDWYAIDDIKPISLSIDQSTEELIAENESLLEQIVKLQARIEKKCNFYKQNLNELQRRLTKDIPAELKEKLLED